MENAENTYKINGLTYAERCRPGAVVISLNAPKPQRTLILEIDGKLARGPDKGSIYSYVMLRSINGIIDFYDWEVLEPTDKEKREYEIWKMQQILTK